MVLASIIFTLAARIAAAGDLAPTKASLALTL